MSLTRMAWSCQLVCFLLPLPYLLQAGCQTVGNVSRFENQVIAAAATHGCACCANPAATAAAAAAGTSPGAPVDLTFFSEVLPALRPKELRSAYDHNDEVPGVVVPEPHPRLCVLARTYPSMYWYLPAFLATWTHMPGNNSVLLLVTESEQRLHALQPIVNAANALGGKTSVHILDINLEDARRVFPNLATSPDHGYAYTDATLDLLTNEAAAPEHCDYLLVTNGDNLYSRHLPHHLIPLMKEGIDLIGFDFVSRYFRDYLIKTGPGLVDSGRMKYIESRFWRGSIDLGAMVFSLKLIRDKRLRFLSPWPKIIAEADGYLALRAAEATSKKRLVAQTLFIHQ